MTGSTARQVPCKHGMHARISIRLAHFSRLLTLPIAGMFMVPLPYLVPRSWRYYRSRQPRSIRRCLVRGVDLFEAGRAVPGGGSLYGPRASFAALGAEEAFAFHGGFRTGLFSGLGDVLRHWLAHDAIVPRHIISATGCRAPPAAEPGPRSHPAHERRSRYCRASGPESTTCRADHPPGHRPLPFDSRDRRHC